VPFARSAGMDVEPLTGMVLLCSTTMDSNLAGMDPARFTAFDPGLASTGMDKLCCGWRV
jgi:hypothetical protein